MLRNSNSPTTRSLIDGKYEILRELGAGGMGVVYEAINHATEKRVALKFLSAELSSAADCQARFEREAKATGRIHHPNVVSVIDYGSHESRLYMVLELLRGMPLREWMTERSVSLSTACQVMFPVMRGVSAAHAVGVLHRDLKPDNIFLCEMPDGLDPVPKVLDFGLAKLVAPHDQTTQLSVMGIAMGTYQFMAPEQLRAQGEEDARTDVYALGAILFSMVAGRLPYTADNPVDLALQILASEPPLLSTLANVPGEAAAVVARALAYQPSGRFSSVEAFALALEPFVDVTFRGSPRVSKSPPARAPLGLTEQISVRALSTPYRSQASAQFDAKQQRPSGREEKPAGLRRPIWPWIATGVVLAATAALAIVEFGSSNALQPAALQTPAGVQDPAVRQEPMKLDAPPAVVTRRPQAVMPADEGLTLVEPVAAPTEEEEPRAWPDNRPAPRPKEERAERAARRRAERSAEQTRAPQQSVSAVAAERGQPATAPSPRSAEEPAVPSSEPNAPAPAKSRRRSAALSTEEF